MEEETEMAGDHQDPRNRVSIALAAGTKRCCMGTTQSVASAFPSSCISCTRVAPKEVAQCLQ